MFQSWYFLDKAYWEGGDQVSPFNGVCNADKLSLFYLNVQNKPTSRWVQLPALVSLSWKRVMGRHEGYDYWAKSNTDMTSVTCPSDGVYLRRGVTPHKLMLNTWNFQSLYKFHYWIWYISVFTLQQKSTLFLRNPRIYYIRIHSTRNDLNESLWVI